MTSTLANSKDNPADHLLYRVYFKLMLGDILTHLGYPHTAENKTVLHEFHKRVLGFESISGKSEETVSRFLRMVEILWAEQGLFVRSSGRQPLGIENMELSEIYKGKRVWDLL
jgi:hypothetical protein